MILRVATVAGMDLDGGVPDLDPEVDILCCQHVAPSPPSGEGGIRTLAQRLRMTCSHVVPDHDGRHGGGLATLTRSSIWMLNSGSLFLGDHVAGMRFGQFAVIRAGHAPILRINVQSGNRGRNLACQVKDQFERVVLSQSYSAVIVCGSVSGFPEGRLASLLPAFSLPVLVERKSAGARSSLAVLGGGDPGKSIAVLAEDGCRRVCGRDGCGVALDMVRTERLGRANRCRALSFQEVKGRRYRLAWSG